MALSGRGGSGVGVAGGGGMARLGSSRAGFFLILLACITDVRSDDHDSHDHGQDSPWEWIGVFDLHAGAPYIFSLEKVGGEYAAPTALISMHTTDEANEHGIEHAEQYAEAAWETTATAYAEGDLIEPGTLYEVTLDVSADMTTLSLSVPADGAYIIVLEHIPTEFESTQHYLQDHEGDDVDPAATESHEEEEEHHDEEEADPNHLWLALAANVIVTCCSLAGIIMLLPCLKHRETKTFQKLSSAFACGALLAACVFILLPEAKFAVDAEASTEAQGNFTFGISVIGGFLLGALIHWCSDVFLGSPHVHPVTNKVQCSSKDEEAGDESEKIMVAQEHEEPKQTACGYPPIVWSVLVGDFFHNITDGVAIAVAFRSCSNQLGWVVMGGAVAHEVSTELADYLILTTIGKMSPGKALLANFLSGASSILFGLLASAVEMSDTTVGCILAMGAGTFLWVTVEAFPKDMKAGQKKVFFGALALFVIGVAVVGVVLLGHVHCGHDHGPGSEEEGEDAHAGHNH